MQATQKSHDRVVMARTASQKAPRKKAAAKQSEKGKAKAKAPSIRVEVAPRNGAMTPEDFEAAASDALGGRGWQKSFRAGTGFAQSTITRYLRGAIPIPQHVAIICEMLQTLRRKGLPVPEAFTSR